MIAAIVSGLLSALSLPTVIGSRLLPDLGVLAWVALVPLYLALAKSEGKKAFRLGFVYGLAHFGVSLYWIFIALHTYGKVPVPISLLGLIAGVALESLFPAIACVIASRIRTPFSISFVLSWVVLEFVRAYIPFGGSAWSSLVYSQRSFLTLLQVMDLTGVYGPLFLILMSNALVGEWGLRFFRRGASFYAPTRLTIVFLVLLVSALVYGRVRMNEIRGSVSKGPSLNISMIQGNIPQDETWQEEKIEEIIARHLVLTERAKQENPDLVIWPEAAFPAVIPPGIVQVQELMKVRIPLLMGVVTYDGTIPENWPPKPWDDFSLHNSAVLIDPQGFIADRYDKVHLVPMGEYVPLQKIFFFIDQIVPAMSSFSPGKGWNLMRLGEMRFGVTICYEDLFPDISRTFTRQGADFLVNLTNDGWYEHSSAVFQHFDFSRYRAIENRRAMVRATNSTSPPGGSGMMKRMGFAG